MLKLFAYRKQNSGSNDKVVSLFPLLLGETKKMITLTVLDDSEPEDDESILISLTHTEGGSRILPSSDTVTVLILANDNVAGVISFQTASRSVIGHEGGLLSLLTIFALCAIKPFVHAFSQ